MKLGKAGRGSALVERGSAALFFACALCLMPAAGSLAQDSPQPLKLLLGLAVAIPFTQQIADGAQAAADEAGNVSLMINSPTAFDPQASIQAMQDAVVAGVQGVGTHVFPPELWTRSVNSLIARGISVVTITHGPVAIDQGTTLFVGENGLNEGRALGKAVSKLIPAEATGKVIVTNCNPGLPVQENRVTGIREEITARVPGVSVPEAYDGGGDPATNFGIWQELVNANPDAVAFLGTCAFDLPNLVKIKEKSPGASYLIGGVDLEPESLRGVKEGTATAVIGQTPFLQGYLPIRFIIEHLRNKREIPGGWIPAGTETVTSANVDDFIAREASIELTKAVYQDRIDRIFSDPASAILPVTELGIPPWTTK